MKKVLYTIGYAGFSKLDDFIFALKKYRINVLIDVRSFPKSAYYKEYNKENLEKILNYNGIYYRNYNREFGARQENEKFYIKDYLDFDLFTKSEQFLEGFEKIKNTIEKSYTVVFMCAEKDPSTCHRNIMVAKKFYEGGYDVQNILFDFSLESQESLENRLIKEYFPDRNQISFIEPQLSRDDMVKKAYKFRNSEIGYKYEDLMKVRRNAG